MYQHISNNGICKSYNNTGCDIAMSRDNVFGSVCLPICVCVGVSVNLFVQPVLFDAFDSLGNLSVLLCVCNQGAYVDNLVNAVDQLLIRKMSGFISLQRYCDNKRLFIDQYPMHLTVQGSRESSIIVYTGHYIDQLSIQ